MGKPNTARITASLPEGVFEVAVHTHPWESTRGNAHKRLHNWIDYQTEGKYVRIHPGMLTVQGSEDRMGFEVFTKTIQEAMIADPEAEFNQGVNFTFQAWRF